jgi:hypothetical protein
VGEFILFTTAMRGVEAASNNGMHPTADTTALIFSNRSGRRVMPGVGRLTTIRHCPD